MLCFLWSWTVWWSVFTLVLFYFFPSSLPFDIFDGALLRCSLDSRRLPDRCFPPFSVVSWTVWWFPLWFFFLLLPLLSPLLRHSTRLPTLAESMLCSFSVVLWCGVVDCVVVLLRCSFGVVLPFGSFFFPSASFPFDILRHF
jgi:hypothetical protein